MGDRIVIKMAAINRFEFLMYTIAPVFLAAITAKVWLGRIDNVIPIAILAFISLAWFICCAFCRCKDLIGPSNFDAFAILLLVLMCSSITYGAAFVLLYLIPTTGISKKLHEQHREELMESGGCNCSSPEESHLNAS